MSPPSREPRSSVILYALIDTGSEAVECRVRNLSDTGACVDNAAGLVQGAEIRVTMGTLEQLVARVMWAKPTLAGLHFEDRIDIAAARRARTRNTGVQPSAGWMQHIRDAYRDRG
ncbi:PilZ domain-containing protein [Sphingomonas sp. BK235]|jgi:hypothetical protein|uniref:PilZ domain-containing protein n=1 Tax=Sphingomonas sp. BK235 TaxID=2512131 RepID=UPI0010491B82|nr:PilZ domain-containing protein [Sphingomonas sp. BK235]TCP32726.1 PilZ domain-containing protein [Sphingomonas sp. BK235]